jgi:hypothetical protein
MVETYTCADCLDTLILAMLETYGSAYVLNIKTELELPCKSCGLPAIAVVTRL